jgi:ribosomal protein L7/L12
MPECKSCGETLPDGATRCDACGTPVDVQPSADVAELLEVLRRDGKIAAIKVYREKTGASLAEAKTTIEALDAGRPLTGSVELDEHTESQLLNLLRDGKTIEAIKVFREATGYGLKDSKSEVEALARKNQIPIHTGCAGVLLAAALVGAAAWSVVTWL